LPPFIAGEETNLLFSSPLNYSKMFDIQNKELWQFIQRFFDTKSFCSTKDCETCN
jgi:hypothetical protein